VLVSVDENRIKISPGKFAEALRAEGVRCGFGHTGSAVYEYPVMSEQAFFPGCKGMPYENEITNRYRKGLCPNAEQLVKTVIGIEISEFYTMRNVEQVIGAFRKLYEWFGRNSA
jgi:dTDP-4-amino-4,6-dideoxygalactose transaminase